MDEQTYNKLLEQFTMLPKRDTRPTFMEICKYPYNRFEEVCSRILQFYLNPQAEHGLQNLWLEALWKVAGQKGNLPFYNKVECVTEEYAEGKRIDIVVKAEDFVIAIENKITARLYNQLDKYAKHIHDCYKDKKPILLVLSVYPLSESDSKQLMKDSGFQAIMYKDLFAAVNEELGNYIMGCDQKYLTNMLDFMKTIENMNDLNSEREKIFFIRNKNVIEELIRDYNNVNDSLLSQQKERIATLLERVNEQTEKRWWAWEGWDLGISFNDKTNRIGIESSYEATEKGACEKFHIYITTWKTTHWAPYKEEVLNNFPNYIRLDDKCDGRVYLHLPIIEGDNEEEIVKTLVKTYKKMKDITDKIS